MSIQDKLSKTKASEARLEEERRQLRGSLDESETRHTKGELGRRALDAELLRVKMALKDKEAENQVGVHSVTCLQRNNMML